MSNATAAPGVDYGAQRVALLGNLVAYLPVTALVCYCVILYETRAPLVPRLSVNVRLGQDGGATFHKGLRTFIYAFLLRMLWLGMLAEDAFGKLTGPSCNTGARCAGQIFHSSLNRFSALFYFLSLCRTGPFVGRGWDPRSWVPPSLVWDMSLLATDVFLGGLQAVVLLLSLVLPGDGSAYSGAVYEAYQWQVSVLALLCASWFLVYALVILVDECGRGGGGGGSADGAGPPSEGFPLLAGGGRTGGEPAGRKSPGRRRGGVHVRADMLHTTPWGAFARGWSTWQVCWLGRCTCACPRAGGWRRSGGCRTPPLITASACVLVSALFLFRIVLFLYAPLTGGPLSGPASAGLYPQFFYTLPELIPPLLILHLSLPGGLLGVRRWYERV